MSITNTEYIIRNKVRFASTRGDLTLEQLWDVPLCSTDGFNLDSVAKSANAAFKNATEESFVSTKRGPGVTRLENTLEMVKHVIATKIREEDDAERRVKNKKERDTLLNILAEKQTGKLSELSEKELQKRIAALEV